VVVDLLQARHEVLFVFAVAFINSVLHGVQHLIEIQVLLADALEELADAAIHCFVLRLQLVFALQKFFSVGSWSSSCSSWSRLRYGVLWSGSFRSSSRRFNILRRARWLLWSGFYQWFLLLPFFRQGHGLAQLARLLRLLFLGFLLAFDFGSLQFL